MAGLIVGFYGYQRSGKTLLAYLLARQYKNRGLEVYTNMDSPSFVKISSLQEIPLNTQPKVLLLDEVYSFMDSRNWKQSTDSTLFFNTIGKQNILLLMTAINPSTIEVRLRQQHNYLVIANGKQDYISYRIIDCQRGTASNITLQKTKELFASCDYDTKQVPDIVDCSLKDFTTKVKEYNKQQKNAKDKGG